MLTPRQRDLLLFIDGKYRETGIIPSFREMAVAQRLQSKSGVHRMIIALVERGFIRRLNNRARAIEITEFGKAYLAEPAQVLARAA